MKKIGLYRKYLVAFADALMCFAVWCVLVRVFPREITAYTRVNIKNVGLVYTMVVVALQVIYGLYDTLWRYINVKELTQLLIVSLFANGVASVMVNIFFYRISLLFLLIHIMAVSLLILVSRMVFYMAEMRKTSLPDMKKKKKHVGHRSRRRLHNAFGRDGFQQHLRLRTRGHNRR